MTAGRTSAIDGSDATSKLPVDWRRDYRMRAILVLLVPGFVGHTLQLTSEDTPWTWSAWHRYYTTPGWHLFLYPQVVLGIAVLLAVAVIGMGVTAVRDQPVARFWSWRSSRLWAALVIVLYAAHYLTYPYRIRNHMSHMLASLGMLGLSWAVSAMNGVKGKSADRLALWGIALITCITYFFAGLHKTNAAFVDIRVDSNGVSLSGSSAVDGLTTFWTYGDLGNRPPWIARFVAAWGTIVIEMFVPIVAWRVRSLRVWAVGVLMAFHVPHVAVMDVADYPMIASCFYPALFSEAEARRVARVIEPASNWTGFSRPRWINWFFAAAGVGIQLWFMPFWGRLTIFGIFVLAIWGWMYGALLTAMFAARLKAGFKAWFKRPQPATEV